MMNLFVDLITFFILIALLAIVGYQLICFVDLEFDYIDPYFDSAAQINKVVVPEYVVQAVFCLVCLTTGQFILCFMSLPYLHYNFKLYRRKRHLLDPTAIFNHTLNREKKQRLIKFVYLIIIFVVFLSRLFSTLEIDDCFW